MIITVALIILFSGSFLLSNTILNKYFRPVSKDIQNERRLLELSVTIDSLSQAIKTRDEFLSNMNRIMAGQKPKDALAEKVKPTKPEKKPDIDQLAPADLQLRREFETNEQAQLVSFTSATDPKGFVLLSPVPGGLISDRYDAKIGHFGLDIVAKKDEPIKCVADGTVVLSSWTSDTGYVIAVQHQNNLISVYKHNSVLLKKSGNFVKAGEIVAIIGNTGELTTGPHLHFELWNNGNPVNPEQYVRF
ncbi:MAG: M23 family metallopeptidase [Verrucomicrobia bacterium]|nr:M23 family metallopeptidase [Cytophagales bacterium]